jgi:uncharacterized protein (TIGR02646 family)
LTGKGAVRTRQLCAQFNADRVAYQRGTIRFSFDPAIYGHDSVKNGLIRMQHKKCCFCEAYVRHISSGDVEHYRPKAGFRQQEGDDLERPGYYWLAYDWENLFFCCELCNRRHKRNLFPLADPARRGRNHDDPIARESPLFVNPTAEDPGLSISFRDEVPFPVAGNPKGAATIAALGLDRGELNEDRLRHLKVMRLMIALAALQPDGPEGRKARDWVERARSDEGDYSAMVRAELDRNHPGFRA